MNMKKYDTQIVLKLDGIENTSNILITNLYMTFHKLNVVPVECDPYIIEISGIKVFSCTVNYRACALGA